MASKAHVQDNSVAERRLRPIYEWLDSGNNKKALQECDKVLKKTPHLHCAKALKALSLLRLGKEVECTAMLDALTKEQPSDDATLQAMTLCYRDLQQLEKICQLYETAVKIDIANEELHTHLFMSYVRLSDFKSQQQCALNLYKLKPKNPYYCWAVMSVILQATRGQGEKDLQKRKLLLSLAERMIDKLISENKLEAEPEVQLYVMVLDLQNKYEEVLQVYDGPLCTKLVCGSPATYKLPYLVKLQRWADINILCKGMLIESIDRWDAWKEYINSVFELMEANPQTNNNSHGDYNDSEENDLESVDDTPEKAHEFICRLVEIGADNGYLLRGPYLARFELCSKLLMQGVDTTDLLGETIELFIEYFRKFGHKPCCVSDLRIYLDLLDVEKKSELSNRLIKDVGISSTSVPQSEQQMQRHICSLQLSRLCGSHRNLSADHLAALVTALSLHYQHGYQTYGLNLLSTDQGPSDAYAILAAHILYDLAQLTESSQPIITALVLLENLLKNSPSSGIGAQQMYESLDVKHLQMDSLGYVHCTRLSTTGLFSLATSLYDTTLKFFASNYKDSSDHLTFSYKYGSFVKLEDFMDFREKLNNSFHYTLIAVDRILLNLVQCTLTENLYNIDTSPKDTKINWDELRDNYDFSVCISWDPETIDNSSENDETKRLFEQDMQLLMLRSHILWGMSAAVDIVKASDGARNKCVDALKQVVKDWESMNCTLCASKCVPINQNIVALPLPSRLHLHLSCPYFDVLGLLFKLLVNVASENGVANATLVNEMEASLAQMMDSISQTIGQQNAVQDCYREGRVVMEKVVNIVEIVCLASLLCLLFHDLVKPTQGKKSKKKMDTSLRDILNQLVTKFKEVMNQLDDCLESWKFVNTLSDVSDRLALLNLNGEGQNNVFDHIQNSHITAVKELRTVLKNKIKFLNCLSC